MISLRILACAAALTGAAVSARASVLYDNLNVASATGQGAFVSSLIGENPVAASFSSPARAVTLTSVILWMNGDSTNDGGSFSISIVPDSGVPESPAPDLSAAPIASQLFFDSQFADSTTPITLSANAILRPSSRYWVVVDEFPDPLGENMPTSAQWLIAPDDSGYGVAGEYMFGYGSAAPNSPTNGAFMMSVDPEEVAEPATLAVLGLGLTGLAALRRRRPFAG